MKILMFNNEFPPLGGGTGTVNLELFNIFKNTPDLKIDLITSAAGQKKETEQFSENINIYKYPVGKKNIHHASNLELIKYTFKASFAGFKLHKKEHYDFVFVWASVPASFPALMLKIFKNIPFLIRISGPDIPGYEKRYNTVYKIITPFIRFAWKKAEIIITKCKAEKELVLGINPKLKINTIFNGVDTEKFYFEKRTENQKLTLVCSARLIKHKGQYILIEAISNLQKQGIVLNANLVGEGDEKDAYIKYAKEKEVSEQIFFSGYVPREIIVKEYQKADLFVLPSYNECMSNSLLEAMACGLPVIVTDVGGTEELVDKNNGFVFKPGDVNALTDILMNIYQNKEKNYILGQYSRKKAETFNWDNIANEYLKLFNNLNH